MSDAKEGTSVQAAEKQAPRPATLKELKVSMPKAGNDFLVACMEADMTLDQAKATYTQKIETDLAEKSSEVEKLRADAGKANAETQKRGNTETNKSGGKSAIGVDPVADCGGAGGAVEDPIVAFNKAVDEEFQKCKNRGVAVSRVVDKHPELHQAMLDAANANRRKSGSH